MCLRVYKVNELGMNGEAHHTMFETCGIPHCPRVFLIWRVRARASAIAYVFHPGL